MKRCYSLKKNKEFHFTYRTGSSLSNHLMVLVYAKNRPGYLRDRRHAAKRKRQPVSVQAGFCVSKKIGNSVVRNRIKRRMKESFRPMIAQMKPGYNLIFIAREPLVNASFDALCTSMRGLIVRAGLLQGGLEEAR